MSRSLTILLYFLIIAASVCLLLLACNPIKKAGRDQALLDGLVEQRLKQHPPSIDTNTVYLRGKDSLVPYPVPVVDPLQLQEKLDSLQKAIKVQYGNAVDCERQIREAFNAGRQQALYELSQIKLRWPVPDTIKKFISNTTVETALRKELAFTQGQLQAERGKFSWLWPFIISICGNAILIYLQVSQAIKGISLWKITKTLQNGKQND